MYYVQCKNNNFSACLMVLLPHRVGCLCKHEFKVLTEYPTTDPKTHSLKILCNTMYGKNGILSAQCVLCSVYTSVCMHLWYAMKTIIGNKSL